MDVFDTFTRPAIGTKGAHDHASVDDGVQTGCDVHDRWNAFTGISWSAKQQPRGVWKTAEDGRGRLLLEVMKLDIKTIFLECRGNGLGNCLGVVVRRDIGDENERLVARPRCHDASCQTVELLDIPVDVGADDGTMAGTDGVEDEGLKFLESLLDLGGKGTHDALVVVSELGLQNKLIVRVLFDEVVEDEWAGEVDTKEVAGDNGLELWDVGDHGVRPVEHRRQSEVEGVAANVKLADSIATASNHGVSECPVPDESDVAQARAGCDDFGIRKTVDNEPKTATVVWLGVVQHNVVDLLVRSENSIQLLFVF